MLLWCLLGILLWDNWEKATSQYQSSVLVAFPNPCNKPNTYRTDELYFCYNHTRVRAVIQFRKNSFKIGGYTATEWGSYPWYLESPGAQQVGGGWKNVFANTGNWKKGSFGTTQLAKNWTSRIELHNSPGTLTLIIDTTQIPLETKPPSNGQIANPTCDVIGLCIYRSSGVYRHPCVPIKFCPNVTTQSQSSHNKDEIASSGTLTIGSRTTARRPTVINGEPSMDGWFMMATGITGTVNNWLLMAEQAANASGKNCMVCMGPRPLLRVVPAPLDSTCLEEVMGKTVPAGNCSRWDNIFPVTRSTSYKPLFSSKVAPGNFTCIDITGEKEYKSSPIQNCTKIIKLLSNFKSVPRADVWWHCGDDKLYDKIPCNHSVICALVTLILPVTIVPMSVSDLTKTPDTPMVSGRTRRSASWQPWENAGDLTYIDAIGVPRGVPNEYKIADQVLAGFESILCWWCTINKNVDRINYIHYNVQRLSNWTQAGFEAIHAQLSATSLMAFQNRIALDMLLAEKGGVCAMFDDQCCTYIPNNTAPDGSLTRAIEGLKTLNKKMKEHSGVDTTMWDNWLNVFGKYKSLVTSVLVSLAVFASILTLCGCCCIPCIRALLTRLINTALAPNSEDVPHMYPLLATEPEECEDYQLENREFVPLDMYPLDVGENKRA
uniref:Envelope polyprotein n=1 Tax=Cynoglossus semilaevis TaxID=244447 RepID=A0A3P8VXG0_CYNSE